MPSKKIVEITEDTTLDMSDVAYGTNAAGSTDKRFSLSTLHKSGAGTYAEADNRKLWRHRRALKAAADGSSRMVIGYLGDSTTEGHTIDSIDDRPLNVCQRLLRERYSNADTGRGYIPAEYGNSIVHDEAPVHAGDTTTRITEGLGFRSIALEGSGAQVTWTLYGTDMILCYASYAGAPGPKSEYRINGGAWVEVDHLGGSGLDFREEQTAVSLGAVGTYTVDWRWKSDGSGAAPKPVIEGIIEINGDPDKGISVLDMGHSGFKASDFADSSGNDLIDDWISDHNVTTVVLGLGFNEWQDAVAPATFKTKLTSLISLLRGGNSNLEIVLHGGWTPLAAGDPDDWYLYVDVMYEIAASDSRTSVYDQRRFMPDPGVVTTSDHYDLFGLHPNDTAGHAIGRGDADHLSLREGGAYHIERLNRAPGYLTVDRHGPPWITIGTRTIAQGNLFLVPWEVRSALRIDKLLVEISTAGTGSTVVRFGIWHPDRVTGYPGELLLDAGTEVGTALGEIDVDVDQTFTEGWYWLGVVGQTVTGSPAVRGYTNGLANPGPLPAANAISSTMVATNCLLVTSVTGALASFTAATSFSKSSSSGPIIQARVA